MPDDLVHLRVGVVSLGQSQLTGESLPVEATAGATAYTGSRVGRGEASGTVTATADRTRFGKTAQLVQLARAPKRLQRLAVSIAKYLLALDVTLIAIVVIAAVLRHTSVSNTLPFALMVLVASVPVMLPPMFTMSSAMGARGLAKNGVMTTRLSAIEDAATMDVLCVDKTGTLTENRQTLVAVVPLAADAEDDVLAWAAAACDESTQNPLDAAIIHALEQRALQSLVRQSFVPFDPEIKRSEAIVRQGEATVRVMLGSPQAVQEFASSLDGLMERVKQLAASGSRVLAVAVGTADHLAIRGLVALADTPRKDAAALIRALRDLGIRVLMVSGDTLATACAVGQQVGLGDRFGDAAASLTEPLQYDGFAQCYPQDKFRLVQTLQHSGRITGMTGDGVNDAPALKQAEVGIAVSAASDVAKASAQVVLTRPGLQDMIEVIHSGRRVYRRMLTWTITKIARTVELAALLAIGYIVTGFFVTSLLLIAVLVILNDIVTITLATDRAWISPVPERWNVKEIGKIASIFAVGWLVLAFSILWVAMKVLHLPISQIQTLMFVYLIYSAQTTIYLTRVRGRFWSFAPSRYVALATIGNVVIATTLGYLGILTAAVPATVLLGTLAAVLAATFVLDEVKLWFLNKTAVFGGAEQIATSRSG